jgi:hypothetical protein
MRLTELGLLRGREEKIIRDLPRDKETVELFKKLSGTDPLPTLSNLAQMPQGARAPSPRRVRPTLEPNSVLKNSDCRLLKKDTQRQGARRINPSASLRTG